MSNILYARILLSNISLFVTLFFSSYMVLLQRSRQVLSGKKFQYLIN